MVNESRAGPSRRDPVNVQLPQDETPDSDSDELTPISNNPPTRKNPTKKPPRHSILTDLLRGSAEGEYDQKDLNQDIQDPNFYLEVRHMISNVQDLRQQLKDVLQQAGDQQTKAEEYEETIAVLRSEKEVLEEELSTTRKYVQQIELQARIHGENGATSSERHSHSLKLPDPPIFSGKTTDDLTFEDWLTRLIGKLESNANHFTNEKLKLAYVVSRLAGDAAKHTAPRLRSGNVAEYTSAAELLEHLKEIYEDPDRTDKARQEFKKLYMTRTTPFHDFYTKFLHLSGEAQINPDELLREMNDKLSFDLRTQVLSKFLEKPTLAAFARY